MAKNKLAGGISKVINDEVAKRVAADRLAFGEVALKTLTAMCLVVLHDEFGFGPRRLSKFQALVEEQADCLIGEYCSLEDLQKLADDLAKKVKLEQV